MADHSRYQKKVIERYYEHRDDIMLAKLGEIVSELFLADSPGKLDRLWARAEKAMRALGIKEKLVEHIVTGRNPAVLARNLRRWLDSTAS